MPGFGVALDGTAINDLVNYLVTGKDETKAKTAASPSPYALPYRTAYFDIFLDHEGYPGVKTPWGTLNAIDLNKGTIAWSIPFGEYPKLAAQGIRNTGTDSYGGAIVTENGLLIIAATTYDNKIRAFDKANGKQYIVIACGGGKNGAPSGGVYVAFALP